jgi:transcriptional regulator with GAF, ATPase, and Fis domain
MIRSSGPVLCVGLSGAASKAAAPADRPQTLKDVERRHILETLESVAWRVRGAGGAAELLGLKPSTLESRMTRLEIRRPGK